MLDVHLNRLCSDGHEVEKQLPLGCHSWEWDLKRIIVPSYKYLESQGRHPSASLIETRVGSLIGSAFAVPRSGRLL